MREIYLIVRLEFVKYITRRATFITIFMLPAFFAFAIGIQYTSTHYVGLHDFSIIDRSKHDFDKIVSLALTREQQNRDRLGLYAYARSYSDFKAFGTQSPEVSAILRAPENDRQAQVRFQALGGDKVLRTIDRYLRPGAPQYITPKEPWHMIPFPENASTISDRELPSVIIANLSGSDKSEENVPNFVIVIPPGALTADKPPVQVWSISKANPEFVQFITNLVSDELRLQSFGVSSPMDNTAWERIGRLASVDQITTADGNPQVLPQPDETQLIVPLGLSYFLLILTVTNSALLLGGVIEEKSSRIVEVMLSCVTPKQFMMGKLIGAIVSALVSAIMLAVVVTIGIRFLAPGVITTLLSLVSVQPWQLVAMAGYFLGALVMYFSIYLAIGSMVASVQEGQALAAPVTLLLSLPFFFSRILMAAPDGRVSQIMSWVPVYSPFFMIFRSAVHPNIFTIIGTIALTIVTATVLIIGMDRIFEANILVTERLPTVRSLLQKVRRTSQGLLRRTSKGLRG